MVDYLEGTHLKVGSILVEIMVFILRTNTVGYFLSIKKENLILDQNKSSLLYIIAILASAYLAMPMTYVSIMALQMQMTPIVILEKPFNYQKA
jgi:hypothetical protein